VATAILGLGAYVYVLGGIVVWLQAVGARLQADDVVAVVENRVLVSVGIRTLFVELGLAVVVAILIPAVGASATKLERYAVEEVNRAGAFSDLALAVVLRAVLAGATVAALLAYRHGWDSGKRLGTAVVVLAVWVVGELFLRTFTHWLKPRAGDSTRDKVLHALSVLVQTVAIVAILVFAWRKTAAPLGALVTVLLVLLFLVDHFPPSSGPPRSRKRRRALAVAISVVALNVVIVAYMATPPVTYDRAEVAMSNGNTQVGAYLGHTSNGVYLAVCSPVAGHLDQSEKARIVVIPDEKVEGIELGGPVYGFDVGHRPTLLALTWHLISGANLNKSDDGVELDPRKERRVCGKTAGA
jgi:hypothetical protein